MIEIVQEDTELIQKILDGNLKAQEILYERHKKSVTGFIKSKYPNYFDIDDDVSEIMVKVFMNIAEYDASKSKFKTWVFSIAKNHMIDAWRCNYNFINNPNVTYTISNDSDNIMNKFNDIVISSPTNIYSTTNFGSSSEFENSSSITYIGEQLSPEDFTLLNMKYIQGYNYKEIGDEFNLTSSTVSNKVNYIKTKLRKNNPQITYK